MNNTVNVATCPRCGSFRLKGYVDQKEYTLKSSIQELFEAPKDFFSLGIIGYLKKDMNSKLSNFRDNRCWICQDCGTAFPMSNH